MIVVSIMVVCVYLIRNINCLSFLRVDPSKRKRPSKKGSKKGAKKRKGRGDDDQEEDNEEEAEEEEEVLNETPFSATPFFINRIYVLICRKKKKTAALQVPQRRLARARADAQQKVAKRVCCAHACACSCACMYAYVILDQRQLLD